MITVAITGRSGVGKSAVTAQFRAAGIVTVDADQVAREVLLPGSACLPQLQTIFGDDICSDSVLNRKLLADRAFASAEGTKALTEITHPEIMRRIRVQKQAAAQTGEALFIIDGAVILGTPCEQECDCFVVVCAPFETSVNRIVARDGISKEMAMRRLGAQMAEEALRAHADYVIENADDKKPLIEAVDHIINDLRRNADA